MKALIATLFAAKRIVCKTTLTCIALLAFNVATSRGQSRTPFLDLLPGLTYSQPSLGAPIGPSAYIPASVQIDLREQPFFSFIYSSLFQQNVDLELQNSTGQALVESEPTTNRVRITLPRTSGFPQLWTVHLTNTIPNRDSYQVATLRFSNLHPHPDRLDVHALGFSAEPPSPEPRISILTTNATNRLFFYNGIVHYSTNLQSNWTIAPDVRNNLITNTPGNGFFTIAPFHTTPAVPPVNLDTNLGGVGGFGYNNARIRPGFQIIGNQLVSTNTVGACMPLVQAGAGVLPNGAAIIKLDEPYSLIPPGASNILNSFLETFGPIDPSRICINLYQDGAWTDPNQSLAPGEAVVFYNPGAEFTVTFIGNVLSGILMNYVTAGLSLRAPLIPQTGGISTLHGYQPNIGDTVTRVSSSGTLTTYTFNEGGWDPSEPSVGPTDGVLINAQQPSVWTRYFTAF